MISSAFEHPVPKHLEEPYSLSADNVQVQFRTDSIDFLAAFSSLDHHELFQLQESHDGDVKFPCVCKIEQ